MADKKGFWQGVAASLALAWVAYKLPHTRRWQSWRKAGNGFQTSPSAGQTLDGCQPWDIGTGVAGYCWPAANPRAALLLQHGFAEHARRFASQYNQLIPRLVAMGVTVYAIDLWGHGNSPGTRGLTDANEAVADHLAARRKLQEQPLPVFLFGHSLGGLLTASSVARDPSHLAGVILSSAALLYDVTLATLLTAKVLTFLFPTIPAPYAGANLGLLYRGIEEDEIYNHDALIYRKKMPMLMAGTGGNLAHDNWKLYPQWDVSVLILHGTADQATNPQGSIRLFETVAAQDKTLHLIEGGYHELLNDTRRDESLQVILSWLAQRLSS